MNFGRQQVYFGTISERNGCLAVAAAALLVPLRKQGKV